MKTAKVTPLPYDVDLEEAEEIRKVDNANDFSQAILTEKELRNMSISPSEFLLNNLITEKSITIINGFRGQGKSWLVEAIGNEVSWGGRVGPWIVRKPVNVLLVDGEMPLEKLKKNLERMNIGRNIEDKEHELYIYPESYAYRIGLKRANLLEPVWREKIAKVAYDLNVGLLILDNLSSLAPGIDENDKMQFDPINRWLLELRFNGVSIIMTHHLGKHGDQRGTSAHEDHVDVSLLLQQPRKYNPQEGCKFICRPVKDRSHVTKGKEYVLQLMDIGDKVEFAVHTETLLDKCIMMFGINERLSEQEALSHGISRQTYYRAKAEVEKEEI